MKKNHFVALAIVAALSINPAFAETKAAATVNGVAISQDMVEMNVKAAEAQGRPDSPELRAAIRDELVNREVLFQAAQKSGLDKKAEVAQQIELAKQSVLINAYIHDELNKSPVTEAQLQQKYDAIKVEYGDKEFNVSHIQLKTEAEAKAIIAELNKKAKFEILAKKSIDTASAEHGGQVGWRVPKMFPEAFANALLTLKKGEYTKVPVKLQDSWHVIKLDDVRATKLPAFGELKPKLEQDLQQEKVKKIIIDLRAADKIE